MLVIVDANDDGPDTGRWRSLRVTIRAKDTKQKSQRDDDPISHWLNDHYISRDMSFFRLDHR
jgi:hypothetical protein